MTHAEAQHLGDIRHHFWLAQSMARAVGVDLLRAVYEGRITQAEWASAVTRCRGCDWADTCGPWLETRRDDLGDVPSRCANAEMLRQMAGIHNFPVTDEGIVT